MIGRSVCGIAIMGLLVGLLSAVPLRGQISEARARIDGMT